MRRVDTAPGGVVDRRGTRMPGGRLGAGLGGIGGIGGIVVLLVILLTGGGGGLGDVLDDLQTQAQAPAGEATRAPGGPDPNRDLVDFLRAVDRDLQDFWSGYFADSGRSYARAAGVRARR